MSAIDAFLLLSFGGPESPDDVMPFLENVTRGRGVPRERLLEVAEHYAHLGGRSPINAQNRALLDALVAAGLELPVYFGNRNWHPFLADTLRAMRDAGVKRAVTYVTSAYRSYSGCRQYIEDIDRARSEVPGAPELVKLPPFHDEPRFLAACAARVREVLPGDRAARVVFTAHSIPVTMAATSAYASDLRTTCARVMEEVSAGAAWDLVYQSRSGPKHVPWLEPDVLDHLRALAADGVTEVVVVPIGFVTDHVEVIWDLDHEAKDLATALGIRFTRAHTVGTHPEMVAMILERVRAHVAGAPVVPCAPDCCAYARTRP